ncbi:hypothetical protein [Helicobacter ailurogastricus]|uniref:Uncharacterized protein n=1 Tax=Helicobacter ailurogastricus TaxID=1578720 RepID=A0A0K2X4H5_9HELI|nr:hypothetical protein [Helicobacter ailurogastricus]CRF40826.1 hypothetical protein HAL011_05930 [Helicobacter ailurogastricus]CRF43281.1 hypothetical protein HAL013_15090 [Helicobacter ailurogastricus]CRF44489.1 hypothetical protein HAL09_10770 [Helicobacter ailurogastricus]GLH58576.1 hypothetical protein NHP214376_13670 [Helicobacter ailurogastricus]GLH60242.1 hypothetical protein NHP214377_15190 [Helicobacter ailurogastricus]
MSGDPELIAKALTLFLAVRAKRVKRACYLVNFSEGTTALDLSGVDWMARLNKFLTSSFSGGWES